MLSYQHAFHAGNMADVQKHALLAWTLAYMVQKDKPVSYIETHAGRGLYRLQSAEALKTGEAEQGISRLWDAFPETHPYRERLEETKGMFGADAYPGSPMIAALGLRESDRLHLAELHPQENAALNEALGSWGAHIRREDGFDFAQSLTPPTPRRGLMLVDPPYEVKSDYDLIPKFFAQVARKWNVGVLMLWYPILRDAPHRVMLSLLESQHPGALRHELRFPPAREGHRMIGTGMFIVNPPFGIDAETARLDQMFRDLG
ncbi:23S rRNA (adenine(2030)-N(6))-methyltransferase RlmJ [Xinfangfangia sp. D13-10-4-6]|uniref:23S rRNA (adenine(2030)-N(6))-methyltransferase RlmJ n=1 Tax=Pseudogemmobacter hezensis TaxID=2737662 RepID=UPI00155725BD|nr:23S rRNA (adenine(2030)-N(6))-methyltransferase RlmJ [Pseudogemmobacter hezensis]NPD16876.1 23S rRNA (adenine(2030)-N(6))-methyltransferase RlmJ [Pseudogemmobacter hezensis]